MTGSARLRFGDGVNGMAPPDDARFSVRMRSGAGAAGNVRAGALSAVVTENERVLGVRNVVAAVGGEEPEPLARVRLEAPRAFRFGVTAVTVDDYAAAARAVPGVADATAAISASGTGPVAVVRVFGGDWSADQLPLLARVHRHLEHRRPAGVALDVRAAVALPVTIGLVVAVQAGWTLPAVSGVVDRALRARLLGPGRFGFGTGLHRSDLVALLAGLPGVADVTLERFAWTSLPGPAHADLQPPFGHVIRIDDDPAAPEHGSVSFRLRTAP
jgi:predicted phage baseplate assembly protein